MSQKRVTILLLGGLFIFVFPIVWVSTHAEETYLSDISPSVFYNIRDATEPIIVAGSDDLSSSNPCPFAHSLIYHLYADETPLPFKKIADVTAYSTGVTNVTIIENSDKSFWKILITIPSGKEKATVYIPAGKRKSKHASLLRINVDVHESGTDVGVPLWSDKDFHITRTKPSS